MTAAAKQVLKSFDELQEEDQRKVYVEILRRGQGWDYPDLTDDDLCQIADELFVEMDKQESTDAAR